MDDFTSNTTPFESWIVFVILGFALAAMWISAWFMKRRLRRDGQPLAPYVKQVYTNAAFTVAFFIMLLAYLTPN